MGTDEARDWDDEEALPVGLVEDDESLEPLYVEDAVGVLEAAPYDDPPVMYGSSEAAIVEVTTTTDWLAVTVTGTVTTVDMMALSRNEPKAICRPAERSSMLCARLKAEVVVGTQGSSLYMWIAQEHSIDSNTVEIRASILHRSALIVTTERLKWGPPARIDAMHTQAKRGFGCSFFERRCQCCLQRSISASAGDE